ncbi:hypothetical protein KL86DPRO_11620 [uncultured delta proteobacterium]|uniref:Uncharacterized protein n=1 Tax=uncultured delta proteobacterium TaxID=34034 RepID=A0A212JJH2_9DELT|nr:hypothetical protein KL86DPRO_11620 [uncultured delta proteobacterium]
MLPYPYFSNRQNFLLFITRGSSVAKKHQKNKKKDQKKTIISFTRGAVPAHFLYTVYAMCGMTGEAKVAAIIPHRRHCIPPAGI